jgi:multidrug efflux system outer membrane protein
MKTFLIWFPRTPAIALATLVVAGCNVGPRYNRPTVSTPPAFRGADDASIVSDAQNSVADQQWSEVFREPELQDLIRTALKNNYDIRIAARRVLEQQAQVQITRSQEFPQVTGGGTGVGDAALQPGSQHRQPSRVRRF